MKHFIFKAEVTLGNILQIIVIAGGIVAFLLSHEHRISVLETDSRSFKEKIEWVEQITSENARQLTLLIDSKKTRSPKDAAQ